MGRYSGLAIRKERKAYLSGRQVEGTLDPDRPVVVVDDSLSSGTALRQAISALEAAGATVEGAVALVGFPGRGGLEAASANGYRVETVLDITADLGMPLFSKPPKLPDLATDPAARLPEGLAPAALARLTARHVLDRHTSPVPPATIAGSPDGRGGVFVSFRRRDDDHRLARDGFWHFDPDEFSPAADVVAATVRTIRTCQGAVSTANLELLKIGVTFLGPMEQIRPAELDFARFAIVVTDVPRVRAGGALPNSQVFTSEVQQYRHAQQRNAGLSPTEPHLLYRQTVSKDIEDDQRWPAYGAADPPSLGWATDPAVGAALLSRVRSRLLRSTSRGEAPAAVGEELPPDLPGADVCAVAVTLYRSGARGFGIAWATDDPAAGVGSTTASSLVELVDRATDAARRSADAPDRRSRSDGAPVARTGTTRPLRSTPRGGQGAQGLGRDQLPGRKQPDRIAAHRAGVQQLVRARVRRRGGTASGRTGVCRVHHLPVRIVDLADRRDAPCPSDPAFRCAEAIATATAAGEDEIRSLVGYTLRNASPEGVPLYHLEPVTGRRSAVGTGPRQLHALLGVRRAAALLGESGWAAAATRGLCTYLSTPPGSVRGGGFANGPGGPLADAVAFAALGAPDGPDAGREAVAGIGARLLAMVRSTGVVSASPVRLDADQDMEFLPGAVLAALAVDPDLLARVPVDWWPRIRRVHQERFRALRTWGLVGWQLQAWSAVHARLADADSAAMVFEIADWAIDRQLDTTGAFLETLSPDEPSFNTGFIAEGIAAAWATALRVGDGGRVERYRRSWQRAGDFMRTLLDRTG